jgi:hypothetical protein
MYIITKTEHPISSDYAQLAQISLNDIFRIAFYYDINTETTYAIYNDIDEDVYCEEITYRVNSGTIENTISAILNINEFSIEDIKYFGESEINSVDELKNMVWNDFHNHKACPVQFNVLTKE